MLLYSNRNNINNYSPENKTAIVVPGVSKA